MPALSGPQIPSSPRSAAKIFASLGRSARLTALPRFKKQKVKGTETPLQTTRRSPMAPGARGGDARPLAYRPNHYDLGGSDDESTTTNSYRPVLRGSVSLTLSTDIGEVDSGSTTVLSASVRCRKRKRCLGTRMTSRLKERASSECGDDDNGDHDEDQILPSRDEGGADGHYPALGRRGRRKL